LDLSAFIFEVIFIINKKCTLSASVDMVLFDYYWFTKNIGIDVEYREYIKYLTFILSIEIVKG